MSERYEFEKKSRVELVDETALELEVSGEKKPRIEELRLVDVPPWDGVAVAADQGDRERRRNRRYKVPRIALRIRIQRLLNSAVDKIYQYRMAQITFVVLVIGSISLIWFFLGHRVDVIRDNYVEFSELGKLETELLQIREVWSQDKMSSIAERVQTADRRRVFVDYRGLAQWLREKDEFADKLDLSFAYTLQSGAPSSIENMLEVPIEVVITTREESADQTYLYFLEFMRYLVSSLWYVEIVGATIESEGQGANRMVVTLRVWVHGTVRENVETSQ